MKHLLIILSILLLSSPVIGLETGVLYLWETSSNWVWKTFGDKNINLKYEGEIKYGEPNGFGMSYHPNGSKYVGEFKGGRHDGRGTVIFSDGGKWVGEFRENEPWNITMYGKNGEIIGKQVNGKIVYKDKSVGVEGKRHNGVLYKSKRYGRWEWSTYGNEEKDYKYVGEIKNGEPNGRGVLTSTFYPKTKMEGEWKDGKLHGQGKESDVRGGKYVGEWKNGKENGQGTYTWPSGEKYVGEFKDGKTWNITVYDKNGNIKYKLVNGIRHK